jgi:hypothetical protein
MIDMLTWRTKTGLFFLGFLILALLILILYLAYLWQGLEDFNWEKTKQGVTILLSFFEQKRTELPEEFRKEVEEMRGDLMRLNRIFWQKIWQRITDVLENIWQSITENLKKFWEIIKNSLKEFSLSKAIGDLTQSFDTN